MSNAIQQAVEANATHALVGRTLVAVTRVAHMGAAMKKHDPNAAHWDYVDQARAGMWLWAHSVDSEPV